MLGWHWQTRKVRVHRHPLHLPVYAEFQLHDTFWQGWIQGRANALRPVKLVGNSAMGEKRRTIKRMFNETNPNSIENKGTLEERTQTNPTIKAGIVMEVIDSNKDRRYFPMQRMKVTQNK
jgi:hypothetical protein